MVVCTVGRIYLLAMRSSSLEVKIFIISLYVSRMEIFGRSLSDFKKPLLVIIFLLIVLLVVGWGIASFVLNLGEPRSDRPEADIDFTQVKIFNSSENKENYIVDVYVEDIQKETSNHLGTDYLIVTTEGSNENTRYTKEVSIDSGQIPRAPDYPSQSESVSQPLNGAVLVNETDSAYVIGVEEGDKVLVYGGVLGRESLVASYEVR